MLIGESLYFAQVRGETNILREIYAAETGGVLDADLQLPESESGARSEVSLD